MSKFASVVVVSLLCAGSSMAGILKMNCKKPICPCSSYGPCAGYFPTQWGHWACPQPALVPPAPEVAPAKTSAPTTVPTTTPGPVWSPRTEWLIPNGQQPNILPTSSSAS